MSSKSPEGLIPILDNLDRLVHSITRLKILTFLYVVEEGDMVYLLGQTELTWGNLSAHIQKLQEAGYLTVTKSFVENKPQTWVKLTDSGRAAFNKYRSDLLDVLQALPGE